MNAAGVLNAERAGGYNHRALLYNTMDELMDALVQFVDEGRAGDEHVLVVVSREKGEMLLDRLGSSAGFELLDAADVYTSPTRTLAAYIGGVRESTSGGRRMRVAGEPIWAGHDATVVAEWACVEAACNIAFAGSPLTMLCPYDMSVLDPGIIATCRHTHPNIQHGERTSPSEHFDDPRQFRIRVQSMGLPSAAGVVESVTVNGLSDLSDVHSRVEDMARRDIMRPDRVSDLLRAIDDVFVTVFVHSTGSATLRYWVERQRVICEVAGAWTTAPFAGFIQYVDNDDDGPGLWPSGQLADLIVVRELDGVTVVRLEVLLEPDHVIPTCGEYAEFLGVFALGACVPSEVVMIEGHLAECAACTAEVVEHRAVVAMLDIVFGAADFIGLPADSDPDR